LLKKREHLANVAEKRTLQATNPPFLSSYVDCMELAFFSGIIGSVILLIGAIWPIERTTIATRSIKNRLFAIGSFVMLLYTIFGYLNGGPVFYIVLELMVMLAIILMFLQTNERMSTGLIGIAGILLMVRSRIFFQWPSMLLFILAFTVLALGYAYQIRTARRFFVLAIGGGLISLSSYLDASWIFFWLNTFFAIFSLFYALKLMSEKKIITSVSPTQKTTLTKKTTNTPKNTFTKKSSKK
jgi:hypothetical protein